MTGTLYGIGVGPGDPELLTVKAVRLLSSLPVLAWPAPMEGDGMARRIAALHIPEGRVEIPIRMGFTLERDGTDAAYDQASDAIARHLGDGRDVGVLCEGDPLFFGSFIYVLERLSGRFPVTVIPGVSSVMAGAAALVHPITAWDDRLAVIPSTLDEAAMEALLAQAEGAVFMKVGRNLPKVRAVLERAGLWDTARIIEQAGLEGQRTHQPGTCDRLPYFSLIYVHKRERPWR